MQARLPVSTRHHKFCGVRARNTQHLQAHNQLATAALGGRICTAPPEHAGWPLLYTPPSYHGHVLHMG